MECADDPFMLIRSMMLTEFRCPPLPMTGQFVEDGTNTIINSHDLMATLVAQAFRLSDETKNSLRRQIQETLCARYMRELVEEDQAGKSFERVYNIMARHTKEYIATYLLGTPFSVHDIHVLPSDHITPKLAKEIDHYGRAMRIVLAGNRGASTLEATTVLDYGSHNVVQTLLVQCARSAVDYEKKSVVDEPVLKRMRNGVDAE